MYSDKFLKIFKIYSRIILIICVVLQLLLFWSIENLFSVVVVIVGWSLVDICLLKNELLIKYTLSMMILLGFGMTQYLLPIIFTLFEGKALIYNLKHPYLVFIHSLLSFIVMLIVHRIYIKNNFINLYLKKTLQRKLVLLKLFETPTNNQIWVMGIIGLIAMFVSYFFLKKSYENISEGVGSKFLEGLIPFSYAPYFLLINKLYNYKPNRKKTSIGIVIVFTAILFAVGIGGNARALFITGIVAAGIGYFIGLLIGKFDYKIFSLKKVFIFTIAILLLTGPLADLGIAMVIAREHRGSISKLEMLNKTIDIYENKNLIETYKQTSKLIFKEWDEHYFDNIFLARFCNLKFNDVGFEQYNKLTNNDHRMLNYSIDRFLAAFPNPVLNILGVNINKEEVLSSSIGDQLFYFAGGENALGGFRTGQFSSSGMASFGWWYLFLLAIGLIPLYFLLDIFVLHAFNGFESTSYISLCGLLPLTSIFMFLSLSTYSQSVIFIFTFILRDWVQLIILYLILFIISKLLTSIFFYERKAIASRYINS